jgi:tetratricopeptide (TPR) repeat protein
MSEELRDIDLAAWDVPEPPDDLADAVVARLGGTDITPAIPEGAAKKRSRALIIAGVAAAVVVLSLGVWKLIGSTDRAAPTNGIVVAEAAQQLSLDGVTADLDVGAKVAWTRDARSLHVEQRTGGAAWHIAADQRLVINAGASMVEVTGKSSLRVEVKMNKVERVVGTSVFAAAAIATVSVIVYDGRVTVENPKHERIVVASGTTYTVEPPVEPPVEERAVGAAPVEERAVGVAAVEEHTVGVASANDVTTCDEVSCVLTDYEGDCCIRYRSTKDTLDQSDIDGAIALVRDNIAACGEQHTTAGKVVLTVRVADSKVDMVKVTSTPDIALGQCVADVVKAAVFPAANKLATFNMPFVFPTPLPPPPASCDAKGARDAGDEAMAQGKHAAALAHYEAAAKCDADPTYVRLAFIAACSAKNKPKAKLYFGRLTKGERDKYRVVCIRNSVDLDEPSTACDAAALKAKGLENVDLGQHAAALAQFEASLRCKEDTDVRLLAGKAACKSNNTAKAKLYNTTCNSCDADELKNKGMEEVNMGEHAKALALFDQSLACKHDSYVVALAFMAACNSQDAAKARLYYGQLSPAQQSKYKMMCERNHVDLTCDADALKNKGMESVNGGQHAAALAQFEASLRCKPDSYVVSLAFIAACSAQNAGKARQYFDKLTPAQQSKYKVMCDRNHVDLGCDADALKDSGMQKINEGNHTEALALFEQSLGCKADPYVDQLAFMAACNSRNAAKARAYYGKLSVAQQSKYEVICKRNNVDLFDTSGDAKGYLEVFSKPEAKILVDGVDTGLTTPIQGKALALAPGKHKVTFVIGGDRYTYFVQTKSGQTDTMTKDLQ